MTRRVTTRATIFYRWRRRGVSDSWSIPRLPIDSFDWLRWLCGADMWTQLGFKARYFSIKDNKEVMRKHAVGFIPASRLSIRPKEDEIAVMFLINDEFCWTHLRMREFEEVFCD